jgi:predicted  nucleic acid-binding Zn-ribbon protein
LLEAEKAEKEMLERWQEETEKRSRQSLAARIADPPPVEIPLPSLPQQDDVTAKGTTQGTIRPLRAGSGSAATEHEDDVIRAQLTEREEVLGQGRVRESEFPGLVEAINRDSEVTGAEPTGAESPGATAGSGCLVEGKPGTSEGRLEILSGVVERQRAELKALQEQLEEAHRELQMQEEGVRVWEVSGGDEKVDPVQAERKGRERNSRERNGRERNERGLTEMERVATKGSEMGWTESERNEKERTDPKRKDAETQWERMEGRTEQLGLGGTEQKSDGGHSDSGERQDGSASMGPSRGSLAEEAVSVETLRVLEGLLLKFEAEIGNWCTLGLLLASVRACKGLLVSQEGSPVPVLEAGQEPKKVAGQSGRHQALLRLLEGAREQRRLAEATLNGVQLRSEDEASLQGTADRNLLEVSHGTERRGQAATVDLLIGLMCKVARDERCRRQQVVSEAFTPGMGLGGVWDVIRRRTDEARTSCAETARELEREVSGFLGLVGSKEGEANRPLERLREAADSIVNAFCDLSDPNQGEIFRKRMDVSIGRSGEVVSSWKGDLLSEAVTESAFHSELDGLQEILRKMQLELASLQQQVLLSRSKVDEEEGRLKRARDEADRAWQEVRTAEREALEVKRQAGKVREKREQEALEVEGQVGKAREKCEQEESKADAERARLREEVQDLREGVWKAEAESWRIKEEGLRVKEEVSRVKGELAAIQKEYQHAKEQREGLLEEAETLETRIRNLKDEMQSAENGLNAARQRARKSRKEAHLAAEAAGKSRETLEELEGLAQEAKRTVEGLEKGRKVALERLKGTESALRRGEEEVLRVQQGVSKTEGELRGLMEEERLLRRGLEGGRRELEKAEKRLTEVST